MASNFKKTILEMYEGFPTWDYLGMLDEIPPKVLNKLIEKDFLIEEKTSSMPDMYMLGPSSLPLISAWKSEELSERIFILTLILLGVATMQLLLMIVQIGILVANS